MAIQEPTTSAPPPSRIERKRSQRIQLILTAAAELVGERGYDAVSLDDVAERLDVTKGSLYHYFPSKEELVSAAIETLGRDLKAQLEQTFETLDGSPADRLRTLIVQQLGLVVRDHPGAVRLFMLTRDWPEPFRSRLKELRRRHNSLFRIVVEDGVRSGQLSVTDIGVTLQCMHAAINQAPRWTRDMSPAELEHTLQVLTDTLLRLFVQAPPGDPAP